MHGRLSSLGFCFFHPFTEYVLINSETKVKSHATQTKVSGKSVLKSSLKSLLLRYGVSINN